MKKIIKKQVDEFGRAYVQTKYGKIYDTIKHSKLIDGGFHGYSNKQV